VLAAELNFCNEGASECGSLSQGAAGGFGPRPTWAPLPVPAASGSKPATLKKHD